MTCPICHKPSAKEYLPFCCKRCADIDLGKWFNGSYTLPSQEPLDEEAIDILLENSDTPN